jgi:peptidoglycan lytic transglycosylase G
LSGSEQARSQVRSDAGSDRGEASGARHRIAAGLPPQPPPSSAKSAALRANTDPLLAGLAKGLGLDPFQVSPSKPDLPKLDALRPDVPKRDVPKLDLPKPDAFKRDMPKLDSPKLGLPKSDARKRDLAKPELRKLEPPKADLVAADQPKSDPPTSDPPTSDAPKSDPPKSDLPKLDLPKPDLAMPERQRSGMITAVSAVPVPPMPSSGTPQPSAPGRLVLGAGEPEPPISAGRPDGLGASLMEQKRITPRSPRVALEPDHVPLPSRSSRPSRRARNPLVIVGNAIFTLLLLGLVVGGAIAVFGKSRFEAPGPLEEDKVVVIPPRSGMMDIAELLQREGVIDEHRLVFAGGVFALKARSELKAGEYLFAKHASVRDVVETIVEGKVVQHQITIPEGLTSEQIVARLLESEILSGNIKDVPREGSLLPDSYHINRGFSREQIIQRMRQAQDRLVREAWERRNPDLPLKTPEQLVVLASIIEKETGKAEERTRVAAVFANRLKQKMKLQSDPTIVYGLVYGKGSLGRPISKADIAQSTPYNTYVIEGLPPGPITNPGRASIEAAANPARTKEVYFVADGTGGHAFAETYDQHLKNVARLRVIEHGGDPGPPAAADAQAPGRTAPTAAPPKGKRSASGAPKAAQ